MTPAGLGRLRCAAALVHGSSAVGLRLRHDGRTLLHVDRWAGPDARHPAPWMPPCAFRAAVAQAHHDLGRGHHLSILGLPMSVDPAVDVCTAPGSQLHPGPVIRSVVDEKVVVSFATLLPSDRVHTVVSGAVDLADLQRAEAHLHVDLLLDVTVVELEQPIDVPAAELERALEGARDLLVACSVEAMVAELSHAGER